MLSWTLICAPIAVRTRLTLYWYLRKIAGPGVTAVYNVLNAFLFCILSGTMITVSASAIRIPFGIAPQTKWYPEDLRFVLIVFWSARLWWAWPSWDLSDWPSFPKSACRGCSSCSPPAQLACYPVLADANPGMASIGSLDDLWRIAQEQIWIHQSGQGLGDLAHHGVRVDLQPCISRGSFRHGDVALCAAGVLRPVFGVRHVPWAITLPGSVLA